jgi:hypothetical protein
MLLLGLCSLTDWSLFVTFTFSSTWRGNFGSFYLLTSITTKHFQQDSKLTKSEKHAIENKLGFIHKVTQNRFSLSVE